MAVPPFAPRDEEFERISALLERSGRAVDALSQEVRRIQLERIESDLVLLKLSVAAGASLMLLVLGKQFGVFG